MRAVGRKQADVGQGRQPCLVRRLGWQMVDLGRPCTRLCILERGGQNVVAFVYRYVWAAASFLSTHLIYLSIHPRETSRLLLGLFVSVCFGLSLVLRIARTTVTSTGRIFLHYLHITFRIPPDPEPGPSARVLFEALHDLFRGKLGNIYSHLRFAILPSEDIIYEAASSAEHHTASTISSRPWRITYTHFESYIPDLDNDLRKHPFAGLGPCACDPIRCSYADFRFDSSACPKARLA